MARLDIAFHPDDAPRDTRSFDPLRPGWYPAQIIESSLTDTKAGDGQRLNFTWEITDGPSAKRRVWQSLNIVNRSTQAQEMAQRDLRSICEAVGHSGTLSDTADLEYRPCEIRIAFQRDDQTKNEVKTARPSGGSSNNDRPPASNTHHEDRRPPPSAGSGDGDRRPWQKRP